MSGTAKAGQGRQLTLLLCLLLTACGGHQASTPVAPLSPAAAVGQKIFADVTLSASGALACATCHNPANQHAQINDLPTQIGGADLHERGMRAAPTISYAASTPAPSFIAGGALQGGFDLDGRAASMADQASGPLLTSFEMGNADIGAVVLKLRSASYAAQFQAAFGANVFDDPDTAFADLTYALQRYMSEAGEFHPFSSKFDQYLAGNAQLTASEQNGMRLFNDPAKGNCAQCHLSELGADGSPPLFTNFRYASLGVPRNVNIPFNADPAFFDLGVCGPLRTDLIARADLCGQFKVPSLRNVATRKVFFHNGVINNLRDAVSFIVGRDTSPARWYPTTGGAVQKFNDLPPQYASNVDTWDAPFNRNAGMAPALSDAEIDDVVTFLETLTDQSGS